MDSNKVQQEEDSIDLLEILELLRKNLWIILLCTIVAAIIGFVVVSAFATPMYQSSSMMYIESQKNDNSNGNITSEMINSAAKLVNTYSVIIKSRTMLEPVIDELGLDYTYNQLYSMVSVTAADDTSILQITVTSNSKEEAVDICRRITETAPKVVKEITDAGFVTAFDVAGDEEDDAPVSPHVKRDTVIMGVLGAVLSIAVIIVVHLFDNKINTEADVAKYLNVTVLGVIPYYEKEKK